MSEWIVKQRLLTVSESNNAFQRAFACNKLKCNAFAVDYSISAHAIQPPAGCYSKAGQQRWRFGSLLGMF